MKKNTSITIVGGGVIGCAIAYELSMHEYTNIHVIERNAVIPGLNQSSTNAGVIHSGIYYPKDVEPLKARLCVEGNRMMYAFCKKYHVPHKKVGKLILGATDRDEEYLNFFAEIGNENGIKGIKKISSKKAKKIEPNIADCKIALYVPSTGSVAINAFIKKLKELSEAKGVKFMLKTNVIDIHPSSKEFVIDIEKNGKREVYTTEILINAAGLYADEIAKMVNPQLTYEIDPARGELYQYSAKLRKDITTHNTHIYPPPFCYYNDTKEIANVSVAQLKVLLQAGKITKTLGVHVSPVFDKVNGHYVFAKHLAVGPIKTLGVTKEDYTHNLKTPQDYIQKTQSFFPHLHAKDLQPRFAGNMAVLKGSTDFIIERDKKFSHCIQLVGMDSPAFTSSLAIGQYVRKMLEA